MPGQQMIRKSRQATNVVRADPVSVHLSPRQPRDQAPDPERPRRSRHDRRGRRFATVPHTAGLAENAVHPDLRQRRDAPNVMTSCS
jgi:hypothetical protein